MHENVSASAPAEPGSPESTPGWKTWLIAGLFTALVAIGGFILVNHFTAETSASPVEASADEGTADQQPASPGGGGGFRGGGFGGGANGDVVDIDGSTLTVETTDPSGATTTVVVETSDDTVVTERVDGSLDDLTVGESVVVIGESTADGITATSINAGTELGGGFPGGGGRGDFEPPEDFQPPEGFELPEGAEPPEGFRPPGAGQNAGGFTSGEVTAVDGQTITIESSDGETVNVTVTDDTTVSVNETRSVSDIETGDTVRVMGETEDSTVTAESIVIGDLGFGPGGFGGPGRPDAPTDSGTDA